MDVKSTWFLIWHQLDHVSWSLGLFSRPPLLEVGLTQNWETIALWMLTTIDVFYHVQGPAWIEFHWNSTWLRANHIYLHTTLEGPWPHYMILEVYWDGIWTLSFGLSQFHGHGSWLVCEVTLIVVVKVAIVVIKASPFREISWLECDIPPLTYQ
jgi:hypothetical protein